MPESLPQKPPKSLLFADDGAEKLHVDADIRGSIATNVNASVHVHDEVAMRKLEMEERRELRAEIEAYRKQWQKQVQRVLLLMALLALFVGEAIGDKDKPVSYRWGEGLAICFYTVLPIAAIRLYKRRPSVFERKRGVSVDEDIKLNNDALLRRLDKEGREDCVNYLRKWRFQLAACPLLAVSFVALARLLVWIERMVITT